MGLRVPGWARSAHGMVRPAGDGDGPGQAGDLQPGTLWRIRRRWQPGDELVLDLPMSVRLSTADPRVDAVRGCVAVERLLPTPAWPYPSQLAAGTAASGQFSIQFVPYSTWGLVL